jgi:replicative DNA helicase
MMYLEDVEKAVLGACMNEDEESIEAAVSSLLPADFFLASHQEIFKVVRDLYEARRPVDSLVVSECLQSAKLLETVGGRSYVSDLPNGLYRGMGPRVREYAERLKEATRKRGLLALGEELLARAQDSGHSSEIIQDAGRSLELIVNDSAIEDSAVESYTVPALDQWEIERKAERSPGLSFGIEALDEVTGG